jgi:3-methyl-2-oxobutanoate hydroxymethyltransferase
MAYLKPENPERVTVPIVRASKKRGERLVCLTAYDYPMGRIVDEAGVDLVLVGDSVANTTLGYGNTVPVNLDEMVVHTKAVRRAVKRALLIADLPFGSYHTGADDTVRNALRLVKEGGAEAVKLEGGQNRAALVKRLVDEDIPVCGHIGLMPQAFNKLGGFRVQGRTKEAAQRVIDDALALEAAGAFAIVLELIPRELAAYITEKISIPTIGIGAGAGCNIQVLVIHDLIGLSFGQLPRFVRQYADVRKIMTEAITSFAADVRSGSYPDEKESYGLTEEVAKELGIK